MRKLFEYLARIKYLIKLLIKYMDKYNRKLIVCGDKVELYEYEVSIDYGYKNKKSSSYSGILDYDYDSDELNVNFDKLEKLEKKGRSQFSNHRSASDIRHLVNCNFTNKDMFITLTFPDENWTDPKKTNCEFTRFIKRFKYDLKQQGFLGPLKYIAVVEFQKDYYYRTGKKKEYGGNVHYHFLCNVPFFIPKKILEEIWGYGYIKIRRITKVTNLGTYISSYLKKDSKKEAIKLAGQKKFFCSRRLRRPIITTDDKQIDEFLNRCNCLVPEYEDTKKLKYNVITFKQFSIDPWDYDFCYFDPPINMKLREVLAYKVGY